MSHDDSRWAQRSSRRAAAAAAAVDWAAAAADAAAAACHFAFDGKLEPVDGSSDLVDDREEVEMAE